MQRTHCIALAALALCVLAAVSSVQAQTKKISYAITDLGPCTPFLKSIAQKINGSGQVIGISNTDATNQHACVWERPGGQWFVRDLGVPENCANSSMSIDVNESGEAVGHALASDGKYHACFFGDDGLAKLLPGEYGTSYAFGVNDNGDVAGFGPGLFPQSACLWQREADETWTFADLGTPSGCFASVAQALNNFKQVVGKSMGKENEQSFVWACLWERDEQDNWVFEYLSSSPRNSVAYCINDSGQIAGTQVIDDDDTHHAYLWERGNGQWSATDLQAVASTSISESTPYDINELGQVVGYAYLVSGNLVAFLYQDGVMHDLNSFLPTGSGWSLLYGKGINDQGEIVGQGYNPAGILHAYIMDTRAVTYSYTSTGSAVSIKDKSTASKAMTLTDNVTITDLNVKVTLSHTRYTDLQFDLVGPDNVTRRLCNAGAVTGSGTKTLVFDDAGVVGTIKADSLSYYDNGLTSTAGKWTLKITDTVKNAKTGSFTSFTLDVMPQL